MTSRSLVRAAHAFHIRYSLFNLRREITFCSTKQDKDHVSSCNEQTCVYTVATTSVFQVIAGSCKEGSF